MTTRKSELAQRGPRLYKPAFLGPEFQYPVFIKQFNTSKHNQHSAPLLSARNINFGTAPYSKCRLTRSFSDRGIATRSPSSRQCVLKTPRADTTMPPKDGNPEEGRLCKKCRALKESCRCQPVYTPGPPDNDPNAPQNVGRRGGQGGGGQGTGGGGGRR